MKEKRQINRKEEKRKEIRNWEEKVGTPCLCSILPAYCNRVVKKKKERNNTERRKLKRKKRKRKRKKKMEERSGCRYTNFKSFKIWYEAKLVLTCSFDQFTCLEK